MNRAKTLSDYFGPGPGKPAKKSPYRTFLFNSSNYSEEDMKALESRFAAIHENSNRSCVAGALNCTTDFISPNLGTTPTRTLIEGKRNNLAKYKVPSRDRGNTGDYVQNNSIDAWEIHNMLRGEGIGKDYYSGPENNKTPQGEAYRGNGLPEGMDYMDIPVGTILGQANSKGVYTEGDGNRHGLVVVGYDDTGQGKPMPMVYDYGKLTRLDKLYALGNSSNEPISNMTVPRGYEKFNYKYFKEQQKAEEEALGIKGAKTEFTTEKDHLKRIQDSANSVRDSLTRDFKVPEATMSRFIDVLPGLSMQETKINNNEGISKSILVDNAVGNSVIKPFVKGVEYLGKNLSDGFFSLFSEEDDKGRKQDYQLEIEAYNKHPKDVTKRAEYFRELKSQNDSLPYNASYDGESSVGPFAIKNFPEYARKNFNLGKEDLYGMSVSNEQEIENGSKVALNVLAENYNRIKQANPELTEDQLVDLTIVSYNNRTKIEDPAFIRNYIVDKTLKDDYLDKVKSFSSYAMGGTVKKPIMKRKKYATGTAVKGYLEDPSTVLAQNQIDLAKATHEANSNPLTQGLSLVGNAAMQYGIQAGGLNTIKGINGEDGEGGMGDFLNNILSMSGSFAMGGEVGNVPVEVEGQEVGQLPNGEMLDFKGPSHEQGGIDTDLPEGTDIYSKRIKVNGKSMAERKKKRERRRSKLEKLLTESPMGELSRNTAKRGTRSLDIEEQRDMGAQKLIRELTEMNGVSFAPGGTVGEYPSQNPWLDAFMNQLQTGIQGDYASSQVYNGANVPQSRPGARISPQIQGPALDPLQVPDLAKPYLPEPKGKSKVGQIFQGIKDNFPTTEGLTTGDALATSGQLYSTFAGLRNVEANRAGDTPNENFYENFGQSALQTNSNAMQYVDDQTDVAAYDLELSRNAAIRRGRNSSRSASTMRAMDLASTQQADRQQAGINAERANQMLALFGQRGNIQLAQDDRVAQGAKQADVDNRADRDEYFTNLGEAQMAKGEGIQRLGKNLNQIKTRTVINNLMKQLPKYGYRINEKGELVDIDPDEMAAYGYTIDESGRASNTKE